MNNFSKLGLSAKVVEVLDTIGFETPTPVQEQAIPILLEHNPTDFIGLAQTGTGKTAAFGLPLLDLIDQDNPSTQALIMAPTRELVQQIAQQLSQFCNNNKKINIVVVFGGAPISNQISLLKKAAQIVVATPGRLIDLIERRAIKLNNINYAILDEADEMLNMGFKEDIDNILSYTPEQRVTWLFSATMPSEIRRIVKKYMSEPHEVAVNTESKINTDIEHKYVITKTSNKIPALRRFMDIQPDMRGILFCRTKRETQQIADDLGNLGYGVEALHGDLSQGQRDSVMRRFKTRSMQLLVATDVAARGIDVNDLTHVIHHNVPDQVESYTHRSGRTGRAGKKGISLALISPREGRRITQIENSLKVKFECIEVPKLEELKSSRINHWASLIINTKVDKNAEEILESLQGQFEHLSKEDLLKRLITTQLDHLMIQGSTQGDLNETKGNSREGGRGGNANRYFINVGVIDGVTKPDLIHFIADVSGVDRRNVADLSLQKNCAYFDIPAEHAEQLLAKFKGLEVDGRSIRVNKDDQGGDSKPKFGGSGVSRGYGGGSRDRNRGGGDRGGRSGGDRGRSGGNRSRGGGGGSDRRRR